MGIYIKGMQMPKNCHSCPMCLMRFCQAGDRELSEQETRPNAKRPEDCPLIPVPPHGRLIDETDVINHFVELANDPWNQNVCTSWSNAFAEAAGDICDMPTIIEAEAEP